ncbi:MAG: lipopolysaccharide assembly protein LapA domain-containing protein [bacterium]|nr:lipopolysaccharide assembly protein LapA domain-containing protein [bacterium]
MPEKTILKLIAMLVVLILLVVFALQNFHQEASLRILFWRTASTPVSIIIFLSVLIGVLVASAEFIPHLVRLRRRALRAEEELARRGAAGPPPGVAGRP